MADWILALLSTAHGVVTLWVTVYGLNSLILLLLYWLNRRHEPIVPDVSRDELPADHESPEIAARLQRGRVAVVDQLRRDFGIEG